MSPSESLKLEIKLYTKWSGYEWYHKKTLHIDGVSAVNGITNYTLYTYRSDDINELIGTDLRRGDILIISGIEFYINKDHCYAECDIWDPDNEVFTPLKALDGNQFNYKDFYKDYQSAMKFVMRDINESILDGILFEKLKNERQILVLRRTDVKNQYERHYVRYFTGIGEHRDADYTIDSYVKSCHKGDYVIVSYYTGYGYMPGPNNTSTFIGIMDVSEEEAKARGLRFRDMYIPYSVYKGEEK